ncbi:MAG: anion permease [Coriobacteriia bacterium]|nr:anion permease [Coriobacteriia bacterium]
MEVFKTKKGLIKFAISLVVGLVIAFLPASETLTREALIFLGAFVWYILVSSFDIIPMHISGIIVATVLVVTRVLTFEDAFKSFGTATPWLIFGVLGFAAALQATGLMKRIALWVLRIFPKSFGGRVTALTAVSAILGPAIPSSPAKASLIASLAVPISQESGYEKNSKQAAGLFTAFFAPVVLFSPIFVSGAVGVPAMMAFMPDIKFSWLSWFGATWWLGLTLLILGYVFVRFFYRPNKAERVAAQARVDASEKKEDSVTLALREMGPMSLHEKIGLITLLVVIVIWITESFHGVSTAMVAICALLLITLIGIFKTEDYVTKVPWPMILIAGTIMTMVSCFSSLGVSAWLGSVLGPIMGPVGTNPYLMILAICIAGFILRFFIVSQQAIIAIMLGVFGAVAVPAGISIFIIVFITWMATATWQVPYVNSSYFTARGITDQMCEHKYLRTGSYCMAAIVMIVCVASVPIWQLTGWIV